MTGTELFNLNLASTTVSSGGNNAPAQGTQQTWTVTSSAMFPVAATGISQFHVSDPGAVTEMIAVINVSGTTWTVIRGAESTTPVVHSAGFTVNQVTTTGALTQLRAVDWLNVVTQYGADPTGVADSTTAIQAAINAGTGPVYLPAGEYLVNTGGVPLTWRSGLVMLGDFAGTFPGEDTIPGVSYLARAASANCDVIQVPDGTNYGRIQDIAIDGNKTHNTAGYGMNIVDGVSGQETQITIERCYFHDNPYSNLYLGNNRRASHVINSIFNQSGSMDGITIAGSDNKILLCELGSNARAGVCIGTNQTQNWAAASSPFASDVTVVSECDIFLNKVGVAVAQYAVQALIIGNGIDRNNYQGITVYDGDTHQITGNLLHTNGTTTDNTYAHIDVGPGVSQIGINNNTFGPLDSGFSNKASYCVNVEAGATLGCILGNIGVVDSGSTDGGLISTVTSGTEGWVTVSKAGAVIQGNSGGDILRLLKSGGTVSFKVTQNGTPVWFSSQQMEPLASPGAASGNTTIYADASGNLHSIAPTGAGGDVNLISGAYLCTPTSLAPSSQAVLTVTGTTLAVFTPTATTVASGSNGGEISTIATWGATYGGNGVLDVASTTGYPVSGTLNVAASGSTTAVVTYTGLTSTSFTGCAYVSGSATGTVATGGAVSLVTSAVTTGPFTAPASGSVVVTASFAAELGTGGTGAVVGLAAHGTVTPVVGYTTEWTDGSATEVRGNINIPFVVTGLTAGTSYNLDLLGACTTGGDTMSIVAYGATATSVGTTRGTPAVMIVQAV